MNIKSINQNISLGGTHLQGYFVATYNELVAKLGKPMDGDGEKTTVEWALEFDDGTVAAIYDWKVDSPANRPDRPYEWHIGGHKNKAAEYVQALMAK